MKEFTVRYGKRGVAVYETGAKEADALIMYPKLGDEIALPTHYQVSTPDHKKVGKLSSFLPEKGRVIMKNGKPTSTLIIDGNDELVLKSGKEEYDIQEVSLEDLVESEFSEDSDADAKKKADKMKDAGFSKGYIFRSSKETVTAYFFEKKGKRIAKLTTDKSNYEPFLPVMLLDRIYEDIEGKEIKKPKAIQKVETPKIVITDDDSKFVRWVKEQYNPNHSKEAFNYVEQKGEKLRAFEYLDEKIKPLLMNGPTGNGKTVLLKEYAFTKGLPYYFDTGNESFKLASAVGKFTPSADQPVFTPGSLSLAAIFGGLYVFEEMAAVDQDELTGLNIFLETGEIPILTHFGHEILRAHENFRFSATGNFHSNYTTNELNDAYLQRFVEIKTGYTDKDNTIEILQGRAPGLDYETAEMITEVVTKMRDKSKTFQKDLGLKGPVAVAQRIVKGTEIPLRSLFEDFVVSPLATYEEKMHETLMKILDTESI